MNKKESKKEKSVNICSECNTPLIEPQKGYVVCPNCGLVHYDSRFDLSGQYVEPIKAKHVFHSELKRMKKWDRISYSEARKIYIKAYLTFFKRWVSESLHNEIVNEIIKEIEKQDEKNKKAFKLEQRYMKIMKSRYGNTLYKVISKEDPSLNKAFLNYVKNQERMESAKRKREAEEPVEKIIERFAWEPKIQANALRLWKLNKTLTKNMKRNEVKAFVFLIMAELEQSKRKQSAKAKDLAKEMNIHYVSAMRSLKKVLDGVKNGK